MVYVRASVLVGLVTLQAYWVVVPLGAQATIREDVAAAKAAVTYALGRVDSLNNQVQANDQILKAQVVPDLAVLKDNMSEVKYLGRGTLLAFVIFIITDWVKDRPKRRRTETDYPD